MTFSVNTLTVSSLEIKLVWGCVAVRSADGTVCLAFLALTFQYSLSTHKIMERGGESRRPRVSKE